MNLSEIQTRMEDCRAKAEDFLKDMQVDGLTDARRDELDQSYEAAMAEFDDLKKHGDKLLKLRAINQTIDDYAGGGGDAPKPPVPDVRKGEALADPDEITYEDAFRAWVRSTQDNVHLTPEHRAVLKQGEARAQSTGTTTEGGFLIPEGFMAEIVKVMKYWGPMQDGDKVRVIMTEMGNDVPWPTVDDTSNTGATKAENAAITEQALTFGSETLKAYNYDSGMILVPWQLLEDNAVQLPSLIGELIGERLARAINAVLTTGAGTSGPEGIMVGAGNGVTGVSKTAGLTAANLYDLYSAVDPAYRMSPNCAWMFNDAVMGAIRKLTYGGSNDARPLWQMGDIKASIPETLLAKPVYLNQAVNSGNIGGAAKDIGIFGDFKKFVVRKVRGMHMVTLRERYADKRQNAYFAWCRVDGRVIDDNALKVAVTAA